MRYADLRCVKCDTAVEPVMDADHDDTVPPADALLFLSYGNYGSRLFDSENGGEYLLVIICDECAGRLRAAGNVMHVVKARPAVARRVESQQPWKLPEPLP